jgi:hypothetical protein
MEVMPLWLKVSYTVYAAVTVAVYARKYPLWNFLWFSDIALIVAAILLPEVGWNAGFFWRLLTGKRLGGLTDYMFDSAKPLYLRGLSLFHVFLPPILLWMVARLGYDSRALVAQTVVAWIVLPLCYFIADPKRDNVNGVFGWSSTPQTRMHPLAWLGLAMVVFPLLIYLPAHFLARAVFG